MSPDPGSGTRSGAMITAPVGAAPTIDRGAVAALLDALDLGARQLDFVAKASTSEVWRADTGVGTVAIRIAVPRPGKPSDFDAEVALRRRLVARGARVSEPLSDRRHRPDLPVAGHDPGWAVDRWIEGDRADAGTADAVWRDLGTLLAGLHGLPASGHGRLRVSDGRLSGRRPDRQDAVTDRLDQPWPFDGAPLSDHPLAEAAPDLQPRLRGLEDRIRAAADAAPVIAHGDLNGANVRHAGGRLTGLIDFADATVLAPAWDFASLRHFQGGPVVERTLTGYTGDRALACRIAGDARLLALVIALHHLSRARTLGLPARRAFAVERLRRGLDEIGAG